MAGRIGHNGATMAEKHTPEPAKGQTPPEDNSGKPQDAARLGNKAVWMGTAVGIGSAAIVAALLYAKRRS